jgi:flagellar biosynthesis protein FlhF
MRAADLRRAAEFYEAFPVRRLIFTRLDETAAYGHMINESVRQKKPISFLGTGPVIPDDIEPADPVRIADLVLKARSTPAWAAAAAV